MSFLNTPWKASTAYAVGQQILSTTLSVETVIIAGTSAGSAPSWPSSAGGQTTDGSVTWFDQGDLTAATLSSWLANNNYATVTARIIDSNQNIQVPTTPGISGGSTPSWNTTPGGSTSDGAVVWTNAGPVAQFAMQSAGGTSGIVEDNVVSPSFLGGTSQVYFTTLANQACPAPAGPSGGCAIQASQPALQ